MPRYVSAREIVFEWPIVLARLGFSEKEESPPEEEEENVLFFPFPLPRTRSLNAAGVRPHVNSCEIVCEFPLTYKFADRHVRRTNQQHDDAKGSK